MRDQEFLIAMNKMSPLLFRKFFALAKKAKVRDDRKSFVEDLVSLTILEALINSKKNIHADHSCEELIRIKARNVWAEFWKQRYKPFNQSNHEQLTLDWDVPVPPSDNCAAKERVERLLSQATSKQAEIINKRMEGFEVKEIAAMHGTTPGAISMQIQRLKEKILKHP